MIIAQPKYTFVRNYCKQFCIYDHHLKGRFTQQWILNYRKKLPLCK